MSTHDAPVEVEPRTPAWLTVLGACLFLALAVWWLAPRAGRPDATIRVDIAAPTAPAPADVPAGDAPPAVVQP